MNIKRNIIFAPESRKKDGIPVTKNVPIRMRVIFASQRIEFTTGYRIDVEKWDTDKQRVRNGCTNKLKQSASEINAELLRQYTEIQNVFKEFEVQDVIPTPAQIKEAFNLKTKEEKKESHEEKQKVELDFMKVFNEFVAECSKQNDWSSSTLKKFATVKKHIYTFDPNTTFDSWTEKHFNDYIEFLRTEKNMRNTSIAKQIKFVKWFLRWGNRKGYHQNMAYDKFTPKMKSAPKKVIFLTQNEINKLRTCPIPPTKKYLERVRDVLLFCCFTGTSFQYKKEKYNVVYVGKSSKSLRIRDYKQHFTGTAGNSTIRKSLGCLLGFKLIPRDINSPQNGKTTFGEFDERTLTEWMKDNLLLFYYANNDYANVEKELIRTYNPPLNLQGNFNKTNLDFRKELSALRSCTSTKQAPIPNNQLKLNTYPQQMQCSNCGINLTINEGLKNEEYIKCLSCGYIIQNPIYIQNKKNKERRQWIAVLICLIIVIIFNISSREYSTSSKSNNKIENYENNKVLSQTKAMAGVKVYLKRHYLKEPDSYKGISWGAFGIYNKDNDTYFALHKYRAKNSYGGYVVEEKLFVLDSDGNVIKVVDDMNEIINGY